MTHGRLALLNMLGHYTPLLLRWMVRTPALANAPKPARRVAAGCG